MSTPSIGLALGGGGVRGLAHLAVLELLDDMDLRPCVIAGCSMGAIFGALYASGRSGSDIRALVEEHVVLHDDSLRDVMKKRASLLKWVTGFVPAIQRGGLFNADRFLGHLFGELEQKDFSELEIPLVVVATDYWAAESVIIREGSVLTAVRASTAVPGVFAPVTREDRVLVDGGLVNHVPYECIRDECDILVAVDVGGERAPGKKDHPGALDAILGAMDIMQTAALNQRLKSSRPDVMVRPRIRNVEMLDFTRGDEVLDQSRASVDELRSALTEALERSE
ncbi:MAG TPA: patatin-like phospholipase family protein [Chromatiales bacterium]|nr:patatin-like phospholipase family protein [Chromatiales bacterium]